MIPSFERIMERYAAKGECIKCGKKLEKTDRNKVMCNICRSRIGFKSDAEFQIYVYWHWFREHIKLKRLKKNAKNCNL